MWFEFTEAVTSPLNGPTTVMLEKTGAVLGFASVPSLSLSDSKVEEPETSAKLGSLNAKPNCTLPL